MALASGWGNESRRVLLSCSVSHRASWPREEPGLIQRVERVASLMGELTRGATVRNIM